MITLTKISNNDFFKKVVHAPTLTIFTITVLFKY